ncbi:gamma-glutamylcyclotransferase [Muricauda oceani]|uniref:Gamma-glutamylcyclotransferase n=1 Tax=Flagellimonas oceani TaxID=2698672 RepID=A0A6G7IYR0_9FLAO|nr:gamma-glutamylcyclotransferase family protein [Allomuricauda oceani]MBW8244867.1 gamma-glutamylcyclotransferase [Allomuricauda oceani]QII43529.1 gamma-glutamylcyclotransferase [Allomuricauda oceani]
MKEPIHLLFSYGTLQLEKVQLKNYGRTLKGKRDSLRGYKIEKIKITDATVVAKSQLEHHPIAVKSNSETDCIEGTLFEITTAELVETDAYEVGDYRRIYETFESGQEAWVYVAKNTTP